MPFHGFDLPACASMAAAQGLTVGLAGPSAPAAPRIRAAWAPALVTPLGFIAIVTLLAGYPQAALAVAGAAVLCVPVLAALAGARLARAGRRAWGWVTLPMLAGALLWPNEIAGQLATLGLLALSCVALGALLRAVGDPRALAAGVAMLAIADVTLLVAGRVQQATDALRAVDLGTLPGFQQAVVGPATMGYGDLFVAGVAGAIAARRPGAARRVGILTIVLALAESAIFFHRGPYPSTVPVVLALAVDELWLLASRGPRRAAV